MLALRTRSLSHAVTNDRKVCDVKNQDVDFVLMQVHSCALLLLIAHERQHHPTDTTMSLFHYYLQLERLRNSSGRKMTAMKRPVISKRPTIQGIWQPDLAFPEFKIEHRS